jgi:hypothetical protein
VRSEITTIAPGVAYGRVQPGAMSLPSNGRPALLLAGAAAIYAFFVLYLTAGLGFSMLQGDAANYWRESFEMDAPYSTWWVPGYPMLIALVRAVTADALPPMGVMVLITGAFYLVAVGTAQALAAELGLRHPTRVALLLAVSPFVGLTYSAWPIADTTAIALALLCQLAFVRRRWGLFAVYAGCALMVHKSMWFFVPPLMAAAFLVDTRSRRILPAALLPLTVWIVAGAVHHQDPLWFLRWGVQHLVVSRSGLPVLDGVLGPFVAGDANKVAKGIVVLSVCLVAGWTAYRAWLRRYWSGLAIAAAFLVLAAVMNQYEIWVVVRYSRLLIVPAAFAAAHLGLFGRAIESRGFFALLLLLCAASNLAYGYYLAERYFA